MAKGATNNNDPSKMYSADVVAAVLTASGTTSLSTRQYEFMSALDGTRTASSFQHAFRAVLARAKELKTRIDNGEVFEPVQPFPKRGGTSASTSPATPKKRKNASDEDGTPSKKKATAKSRPKKTADLPTNDLGNNDDDLAQDMEEFIKHEQEWENAYALGLHWFHIWSSPFAVGQWYQLGGVGCFRVQMVQVMVSGIGVDG
ncbi:hypothetical protein BKA63DRAFT_290506 [Paraphoma chrysanthemicola]|nr:hypothetical protein BKA63DRAFT_290506 [Paraphoma chrysanthemicola]